MTYQTLRAKLMERREQPTVATQEQIERCLVGADSALDIGRRVLLSRDAEIGHIAASTSDIEKAILELGNVDYARAMARLGIYKDLLELRETRFGEAVHE